jgi:thiamine pyrophosphate-dependent acetolactate synthase large subunit-like protein
MSSGEVVRTTRAFEVVANTLAQSGITAIFGLMGEDNAPLVSACVDNGITYYPARHENLAVAMADGYFRATGRTGIALVTGGPGLSNCLTALTTAKRAGSSVLLICGGSRHRDDAHDPARVRTADRIDWLKHFPTSNVLHELGVATFKPAEADQVVLETSRALAATDKGTVALVLGRQILLESVASVLVDDESTVAEDSCEPDPEDISAVADLLGESWAVRRPIILAGRGALRSEAGDTLRRLGEITGALLATTLHVSGMFAADPYSIGICGTYATSAASSLIVQADCVLSFGASLNPFTTFNNTLFPKAHLVQVDRDESALSRFLDPVLAVKADAHLAAQALLKELERRGHQAEGFRTPETRRAIAAYSKADGIVDRSTGTTIDPHFVALELDRILPADRIVCTDTGQHGRFTISLMSVNAARNFAQSVDGGSIGLGIGLAIGAQVGRPDNVVAACVGDGGLAMSLGDLETAARLKLPLLVVVYSDDGFGAEVSVLQHLGMPTQTAKIPAPSFSAIATALGAEGATVRAVSELAIVDEWLRRGRPGPLVLDCRVNQSIRPSF